MSDANVWIKGVATKWSSLTEQDKQPYLIKARELRAQYKKEREEWEKNTSPTGLRQHRKIARARRAKRALKDSLGQPVKRPLGVFAAFLSERKKEFSLSTDTASDNPVRLKRAGRAWAALPNHEKELYKQRYQAEMVEYRKVVQDLQAARQ